MIDVQKIDALLPQTQCGECSYAGCMPYAQALAAGRAGIDRCPPGGVATVKALGALLGIDPTPYLVQAQANTREPSVAVIREAECIGCTKCIAACPVDAIIGTGKMMHAVISHDCTGCGLCVAPCPVDCIEMQVQTAVSYDPDEARSRFQARQTRLLREEQQKQQSYRQKRQMSAQKEGAQKEAKAKLDYIVRALARVKAKNTVKPY